MTEQVTTSEAVVNRSAVTAVFLMVLGLTYSDDVVEFVSVLTGHGPGFHHGIVFLVDCLLVLAAAVLKWRILRRVDPASALGPREFLPVLLRSWWAVGAALLVAVHVVTAVLGLSLGVKLVGSAFFAVAMGLVLVGALDTTSTRAGAAANGWIVPLVTGTLVVQTATALWFDVISIAGDCADEIATDFFAQMAQVIPLLLITLGLEMNVLRRNRALHTPGQYAAPVADRADAVPGRTAGLLHAGRREPDRVRCGGGVARIRRVRGLRAGDVHRVGHRGVAAAGAASVLCRPPIMDLHVAA